MAPRRSKRNLGTNRASEESSSRGKQLPTEAANDVDDHGNSSCKEPTPRKRRKFSQPVSTADDLPDIPSKPENTCGLETLPTELLTEIISYLPSLEIPFRDNIPEPILQTEERLSRLNFLRALSQTCRHLRSFALPLCWETIEVASCDPKELKRHWRQSMATELIRQLEIVTIRDPSLAQYVKVVNVMITSYSAKAVINELARCLPELPNLEVLQVLGEDKTTLYFKNAFEDVHLPTVYTISLMRGASSILKSCPNVRKVRGLPSIGPYPDVMPLVEDLGSNASSKIVHFVRTGGLANRWPNLKVVDLTQRVRDFGLDYIPGCLPRIRELEALLCIRIHYFCSDYSARLASRLPYYNARRRCKRLLEAYPPPPMGCHRCLITIHEDQNDKTEHYVVGGKYEGNCVYLQI